MSLSENTDYVCTFLFSESLRSHKNVRHHDGNKVERRNGDKKDQYSLDIDHHEATAEPQDLKSIQGTLQLFYSSIANGFQQLNYERY
mmetsp:Transcript_45967/g.62525  ORF Transcript_45967/g.62525 Transcript_45967/m.62525 type:complete len:87 (-) Transcript_45967:1167-1427(-)